MAVAFVAAGAQTTGTAAATVALPAGISTNDILLLCVEECNLADGTVSDAGGGTWAEIGTATTVATLTNRAIARVFWSRYNGSQTDPTWTPSANHFEARIAAYSGCKTSGDPFEGVDTALDESGDANLSFAVTATDTSTAVMVILVAASKDDNPTFGATWSNSSLSSINVRVSDITSQGNDGSLDVVEGVLASAGDKGTWTNTLTGAANSAGVCFGLIPDAGAGPQQVDGVVLTTTISMPAGSLNQPSTTIPFASPDRSIYIA